ncbi:MAG TPA: hypothetical protein PK228_10695 [Saprospiraceae bacterium]|nr:hypothetical protein [Saprospiraceae bacterium]
MKRTFAKRSLMSLVAGFFLFGFLLLTAGRAQAQTLGGEHNWFGIDEAQLTLVSTVATLHTDLAGLQPGTPGHNNKLAHVFYYKEIYRNLTAGVYISVAVKEALEIFSGTQGTGTLANGSDVSSAVSVDAALKQQLYNDAVSLLTN